LGELFKVIRGLGTGVLPRPLLGFGEGDKRGAL